MSRLIDLTGERFGMLVVEHRDGSVRGEARWRCRCDCGTTSLVRGNVLRSGRTRSCGCATPVAVGAMFRVHGLSGRPEYRSWAHMTRRCTNPQDDSYPNYGGRGIRVCDRWLCSFEAFLADMGERPVGTSLDRINVNGNYEPGNCRWATTKTQARNTRHTKLNENDASRIRAMRESGLGCRVIGRRMGIGHDQVSRICNGKAWAKDEVVLDEGQVTR